MMNSIKGLLKSRKTAPVIINCIISQGREKMRSCFFPTLIISLLFSSVVTWIPCHGQVPIRYLVCLNRLDSVAEMRREMTSLVYGNVKPDDTEVILAEVFDNHISKILVSGYSCFIHSIHRFKSSDWLKEGHMTWIILDNVQQITHWVTINV